MQYTLQYELEHPILNCEVIVIKVLVIKNRPYFIMTSVFTYLQKYISFSFGGTLNITSHNIKTFFARYIYFNQNEWKILFFH